MRPVRKGASPIEGDFKKYEDAKPDLVSRLGQYCSYCERRIATLLAVEHIKPKKGEYGRPDLEKNWTNFLLACTNCNSSKGSNQVNFLQLFVPDRDNTFEAFTYTSDGEIKSSEQISEAQKIVANNTLNLVGLDKARQYSLDSNEVEVALDRVSQRKEVWLKAEVAVGNIQQHPQNDRLKDMIIELALAAGFFSVWLTVFESDIEMKLRLISAFKGTGTSGCFDMNTGNSITPSPNLDELSNGGKI